MLSTSKKSWLSRTTVSYLFAVCIITFALNKQKNKQHNSKKQKNLANKQISQILVEVNVLLASRHNMVCSYSKEEESLEPFLYQFFIKLSSICILGLSWITLSCMLTFLKFTFWLSISPSQSKICGDILILTDRRTTRHFYQDHDYIFQQKRFSLHLVYILVFHSNQGGDSGVNSAPLLTQAENSEPKDLLRTEPRENERTTTDDGTYT